MVEDDEPSKRRRQKERREARRQQEQQSAQRARRRRTLATVGVVVVALAGVGALLSGQVRGYFERRNVVAEADERLAEVGCTPIEEMEDLGAGHFEGAPAELDANPPEDIYAHRPTTSGRHLGQVAVTGVYSEPLDERLTTHNMEHGYVIVHWDPELDDETVEDIKSWAEERIADGSDHLIAAPYIEPLPEGASVSFTSWGHRQLCDDFDSQVAQAYLVERHNAADVPEPMAGPHLGGNPGELDPASDAVLFPPFADATPGASQMQDTG